MFVNCKHCNALVATDPATDLPPERCPRCAGVLRRAQAPEPEAHEAATAARDVPAPATDAPPPPPGAMPQAGEEAPVGAPTASSLEPAPLAPAQAESIVTTEAAAEPGPDPTPAPGSRPEPGTDPNATPMVFVPLHAAKGPSPREDASPAKDDRQNVVPGDQEEAPREVVAPAAEPPATPVPSGAPAASAAPEEAEARTDPATRPDHVPVAAADAPTGPITITPTPAPTTTAPAFLARTTPTRPPDTGARRWALPAAAAGLAILLALQVIVADRERLARDARWRPLVASVCGLAGCSIAPWHQPAAFALLSRDVRPHPQVKGALRVRASFRNDARWPQAWPRVLLTLSDVDGRAVGARVFEPDDYRARPGDATLLSPGQTADIALDILEPANPTVSFAFEFH